MTKYELLTEEAYKSGLSIKEKPLQGHDGRIYKCRIAIRRDIETNTEKTCVLAEELGHYYTTTGDILDQSDTMNRKQEYRARLWGYNRLIGLMGTFFTVGFVREQISSNSDCLSDAAKFNCLRIRVRLCLERNCDGSLSAHSPQSPSSARLLIRESCFFPFLS